MSEEMTNKQAMEILEAARKTMYLPKSGKYISDMGYALEKGIAALEAEPCEDAISRQAAIQAIYNNINRLNMAKAVHELPSVTPKQRTGHWIECEDEVKCFCSECKEISDYPTKFCPNCGAKMVDPQERSEE